MMKLFSKGAWRTLLAASLLLVCLTFAGCNDEEKPEKKDEDIVVATEKKSEQEKKNEAKVEKKDEKKEMEVKLYFPNEEATKLIGGKRWVQIEKSDRYTAAVQALLDGPTERGQIAILPKQTKLLGVKVKDGIATVDFSKNISKNFVGGSTGEEMLVASVVNTLTEFEEIKSVRFLVEGEEIESIGGHIDLSEPIKRMKNLL